MSHLLINEPPLQVIPSLANKVGLNEALILQQLHFRSLISSNIRDGHKWVYKTYEEWQDEFPFWSKNTIVRAINNLEKGEYIIATSSYNKMRMDKTKWYRVNYEKLIPQSTHNGYTVYPEVVEGSTQNGSSDEPILGKAITKEIKNVKKESVEKDLDDVSFVIDYLNQKTGKNFKANASATKKFISGRMREGHTLEDFKRVIDVKYKQWVNDPHFKNYLRPSTLFNPTNFENYLNENEEPKQQQSIRSGRLRAPQLDFSKGEE